MKARARATVVAATVLLAGCGSDDSSSSTKPDGEVVARRAVAPQPLARCPTK